MVDTVGLRFVTEGEAQALRAFERYRAGLLSIDDVQDKHVTAFNRRVAEEMKAMRQQVRIREESDAALMRSFASQIAMMERTKRAQEQALRDEVRAFQNAQRIKEQSLQAEMRIRETAAAQARTWAAGANERLGVTGPSAVDSGATFDRLIEVQRNLDAASTAWTNGLESRLGVVGQRATQLGATFGALVEVQRNLERTALAWTAALNERMGITGQSALQQGAGFETLERAIAQAETGLNRLRASYDPTAAAAQRLQAAQNTVNEAVRRGVITAEKGAREMQQYQAALDNTSKANEMLRVKTEMLARAYNPVMAAQMVYQRQVEQLNEAHRYGVLSADQLEAKLAELGTAYTRVGADALRAQHFTNQFGAVTHFAGVSTNRFGMVAQQVGYQVGDYFVQIQSGTNAFVAFGQQATQLAGLLPGVVGAVGGIGISVSTMLLATWDRTRRANDEAAQSADRYTEALKSMREQAATTRDELTALFAGYEGSESGAILRRIEERTREMEAFREATLAQIAGLGSGRGGATAQAARDIRAGALREELEARLRLTEQQNAADQQALELERARVETQRQLSSVTDRIGDLNEENALIEAQLVYMRQGVEIDEARRRAQEDALLRQAMALADSTTATEEQRAAAARFVEELAEGFNRARELEAEMKNVGTQSETARRIAESLSRQIGTAADAAIRLRDAMASVGTASLGRLEQATILRAQISAAQRGLSVPGAEAAAQTALQLGRSGATADQIAAAAERARRETETVEALRQQLSDLTSPANGGGSSGGGEQGDIQSTIDSMQRRIEQERTLVSLFGQQRAAMEIYYDLRDANDQADIRMSDERLMRYAEELARQQELLNLERQRESQVQQIGQAFENMFVSAWTGARSLKEALGGLAQQLAQIYAQRAFQQLFGGFDFGKFLPFANGGVIAQGNVVPFADGGVVSRATTFPMASGRTGLMGEAGPEAIMPLRRGADGKLGVAGQTSRVEVVVQLGVPEGVTVQEATTIAGNVAVQVVRAGMRRNQQQLPGQLNALEARGTTR